MGKTTNTIIRLAAFVLLVLGMSTTAMAQDTDGRYYVAPGADMGACTAADPCQLEYVVETQVSAGDEVAIRDGIYTQGTDYDDNLNLTVDQMWYGWDGTGLSSGGGDAALARLAGGFDFNVGTTSAVDLSLDPEFGIAFTSSADLNFLDFSAIYGGPVWFTGSGTSNITTPEKAMNAIMSDLRVQRNGTVVFKPLVETPPTANEPTLHIGSNFDVLQGEFTTDELLHLRFSPDLANAFTIAAGAEVDGDGAVWLEVVAPTDGSGTNDAFVTNGTGNLGLALWFAHSEAEPDATWSGTENGTGGYANVITFTEIGNPAGAGAGATVLGYDGTPYTYWGPIPFFNDGVVNSVSFPNLTDTYAGLDIRNDAQVYFWNGVNVAGNLVMRAESGEPVELNLMADAVAAGETAITQIEDALFVYGGETVGGVEYPRIYMDADPNGSGTADNSWHNLAVAGDVDLTGLTSTTTDDYEMGLFRLDDPGDDRCDQSVTELNDCVANDPAVADCKNKLILNGDDATIEGNLYIAALEINKDRTDDAVILPGSEVHLVNPTGGFAYLLITSGNFNTEGNLYAEDDRLILTVNTGEGTLDYGDDIDDSPYADAASQPYEIRYTGEGTLETGYEIPETDTGDPIFQVPVLTVDMDTPASQLELNDKVQVTERLALLRGVLNLSETLYLNWLGAAPAAGSQFLTIVIGDANIITPNVPAADVLVLPTVNAAGGSGYIAGEDGLDLVFVNTMPHVIGDAWPTYSISQYAVRDVVVRSGAVVQLPADDEFQFNGDMLVRTGGLDLNGSVLYANTEAVETYMFIEPETGLFNSDDEAGHVEYTGGKRTYVQYMSDETGRADYIFPDVVVDKPGARVSFATAEDNEDNNYFETVTFGDFTVVNAYNLSANDYQGVTFYSETWETYTFDCAFNIDEPVLEVGGGSGATLIAASSHADNAIDRIVINERFLQMGGGVRMAGEIADEDDDYQLMTVLGDFDQEGGRFYTFAPGYEGGDLTVMGDFTEGTDATTAYFEAEEQSDISVMMDYGVMSGSRFILSYGDLWLYGDYSFMGSGDVLYSGSPTLVAFPLADDIEMYDTAGLRGWVNFVGTGAEMQNLTMRQHPNAFLPNVLINNTGGGVNLLSDMWLNDMDEWFEDLPSTVLYLYQGVIDTDDGDFAVVILNEDQDNVYPGNNPVFIDDNIDGVVGGAIAGGTNISYVERAMTRRFESEQEQGSQAALWDCDYFGYFNQRSLVQQPPFPGSTGGDVYCGYFFPVGNNDIVVSRDPFTNDPTRVRDLIEPIMLEFDAVITSNSARVTLLQGLTADDFDYFPIMVDERVGQIPGIPQSGGQVTNTLELNTIGDLFWKVEFDEAPAEDPNIRLIVRGMSGIRDLNSIRILQLPCLEAGAPQFPAQQAGIYDMFYDPGVDDESFFNNDYVNGVPNFLQEGVDLRECQIFAIASDVARNPLGIEIENVYPVSGQVLYGNTNNPVDGAAVVLNQGNATFGTDVTNAQGNWIIPYVPNGTYTARVVPGTAFDRAQINVIDAQIALKIAAGTYTGTPTPEMLAAADVNGDGSVTVVDVQILLQYIANKIATLPVSAVATQQVVVADGAVTGVVLRLWAAGDVNQSGNYLAPVAPGKEAEAEVQTVAMGREAQVNVSATDGEIFEVPVRLASARDLAGFQMRIAYPTDRVSFEGVSTDLAGMVTNEVDGDIYLVWVATENNSFSSDKDLAVLKFRANGAVQGALDVTISSDLIDDAAQVVSGDVVLASVEELPGSFELKGNYPNPFNPSTTISFDLPATANVTIEIVDMMGRKVMTLPAREFTAGSNQKVQIDASSLASGTYVYRVVARSQSETFTATGQMTLLK